MKTGEQAVIQIFRQTNGLLRYQTHEIKPNELERLESILEIVKAEIKRKHTPEARYTFRSVRSEETRSWTIPAPDIYEAAKRFEAQTGIKLAGSGIYYYRNLDMLISP